MTLDELNALERDPFVDAVGWVFEHSPWVADRVWPQRPFRSLDELHGAMVAAMHAAPRSDQLSLLCAHPDLGAKISMSAASVGEQAGAGLTRLAPADVHRLQRLNTAYRDRFGFPFLYAVKGSSPQQILEALEERLPRDRENEFEEALRQVARIARFRLEDTLR